MQTTTPQAIRRAFVTAIKAISPTLQNARRFREVRSVDAVPGTTLRNFHIDVPPVGLPVTNGSYGSGVEFELNVAVYVNYGGLAPEDDDSILTEDGASIWATLQALYDPALPGLRSVEPSDFTEGTSGDEAGYRWGAFGFRVRYLHNV